MRTPPRRAARASVQPRNGRDQFHWHCPCLGQMTQPPCGEKFKRAFSCFVYSTQEPKGLDCIEQSREMQLCFWQYPEIYGDEADDDDNEDSEHDDDDDDDGDDNDDDDDDDEEEEEDEDSESEQGQPFRVRV